MNTFRDDQSIAIIGLAGRFPKAPDPQAFWRLLRDGEDGITRFSIEELIEAGIPRSVVNNPSYVRARGIIADDDRFDAALFGMAAPEAERTDPQQRVWLECALSALEDAGCNPQTYKGLIGVFAGVGSPDYLLRWPSLGADPLAKFQVLMGNDKDFVAARTSYKLGLRGPSLTVQTACSTSLVAVVLACQQLLSYHCDVAIAGGASLSIPSRAGYLYREGMILSPDGCCRAFDARAQGTVPGDGVGAVVLKRLPEALADGDDIYAVIRGAATNNDGDVKVGYTAPSVPGQVNVITQALAYAGLSARDVSYVEAHGTGTPMGDPIEFAALLQVFQEAGAVAGSCALGSVKSNIGHLNTAAGVAGLIKAVLALQHRAIPATRYFERANPEVTLAGSPFYVNRELRPWTAIGPLIAGVSSFGIGGTNAHVIVSEAPPRPRSIPRRRAELLPISAATPHAAARLVGDLAVHLEQDRAPLASLAHTLQTGRIARRHRYAVIASDGAQAARKLRAAATCSHAPDGPAQLGFLFPGQGAQWSGMAAELAREEPQVREELLRTDAVLRSELGLSLLGVLDQAHPLENTQHTQPILFAVEYALARVLMRWGLSPAVMLGHSLGEYVAACLAGVFPLEEALSLVSERGRLMADTPPGAMLSVPLSEQELLPLIGTTLDLAAVNGASQCVVSGAKTAIDTLAQELAACGLEGRPLRTTRAFHSRLMDPIVQRFTRRLARVPFRAPQTPFLSCLTGDWIAARDAMEPEYWARQLRGTVRFDAALAKLLTRASVLIEVGPGETLSALARRHPARPDGLTVLATLGRSGDPEGEVDRWLGTVGRAWCAGAAVDWAAIRHGERVELFHLPSYPFERQRYWGLSASGNTYSSGTLSGTQGASSRTGRALTSCGTSGGTMSGRRSPLSLHGPSILDPGNVLASAPAREPALPRPPGPAGWLYEPVWRPAPKIVEGKRPRRWMVLADRAGLGEALARRLGNDTVLVFAGERFANLGGNRFTVGPASRADLTAVLSALGDRVADGIVHAFALDSSWKRGDLNSLDATLAHGYFSVVALAQALGLAGARGTQVTILTAGAQAARGAPTDPVAAMISGLIRVLPIEYPDFTYRHLDLVSSEARDDLLEAIETELAASFASPSVAIRSGERLVRGFAPIGEVAPPPVPMRQGGVYVVTGGLGGIGLTLAEHLAVKYGARLVLASRTGLWPESQWPRLRARPPHDEERIRLETYLRVRAAAGDGVLISATDVADEGQARALVELTLARFGALHGVIHAAGVTGGGSLQRYSPESAHEILRAKVHGTLALDAALSGIAIDFFLLCSSLTALTGGFGQADYAAANAFLDAFAESANRPGERLVVSVNWDGWREVGAAARHAARLAAAQRPELPSHPLIDGWEELRGGAYRTDLTDDRWIVAEHHVGGRAMVPGTVYVELVCAAARARGLSFPLVVKELVLLAPYVYSHGERGALYTSVHEVNEGLEIRIESQRASGEWRLHATAHVTASDKVSQEVTVALPTSIGEASEVAVPLRVRTGYVDVGPRWQCVDWIRTVGEETVGHLRLPETFASEAAAFTLHPALFDALANIVGIQAEHAYLPFSYSGLEIFAPLGTEVYCVASEQENGGTLHAGMRVVGMQGQLLVSVADYTLRLWTKQQGD